MIVVNDMKKKILMMILLTIVLIPNVYASSGTIKQNGVIKCDGKYYGYHGSPKHWHIVEKKDGKWVVKDKETVQEPSCYADITNEKITVTLEKCVDGDTAKFKTSSGKVHTTRFLAIDTPESVHPTKAVEAFGKEASEYTCNLLTKAKKIELEFDKNSDKEDKYGRWLAFVYADSTMVQKELLEIGYAKVAYLYADYTYTSELKEIEAKAKEKKLGIWGNDVSKSMDDSDDNNDTNDEDSENDDNQSILDIIWEFVSKLTNKIFKFIENML